MKKALMVCLGFEPGAAMMVGADKTTELWRPPQSILISYFCKRDKT